MVDTVVHSPRGCNREKLVVWQAHNFWRLQSTPHLCTDPPLSRSKQTWRCLHEPHTDYALESSTVDTSGMEGRVYCTKTETSLRQEHIWAAETTMFMQPKQQIWHVPGLYPRFGTPCTPSSLRTGIRLAKKCVCQARIGRHDKQRGAVRALLQGQGIAICSNGSNAGAWSST